MNAPLPGGAPPRPGLPASARLIALGGSALMEGFALIGFETYPNPAPAVLENLFQELLRGQQAALVVIEQGLEQQPRGHLARALREGGHIVITEIPGLQHSTPYHSRIDRMVQNILGPAALKLQE